MIYLLLAILCSTGITVFLRLGQKSGDSRVVMLGNYVAATAIGLFLCISDGAFSDISRGFYIALGLGVVTGGFFLLSFVLIQRNFIRAGVSMTTMFGRAGVIIPIAGSIILWREIPGIIAAVGILVMLFAMVYSCYENGAFDLKKIDKYMIVMILSNGLGGFLSKVFAMLADEKFSSFYVFVTFATALVLCVFLVMGQREQGKLEVKPKVVALGLCVGFFNIYSSIFIIKALVRVSGAIAYPAAAAGSLVTIVLACAVVFKERLSKRQLGAIVLTAIGVILINI